MDKSPDAFRTISEVADDLDIPQHVLRFWETRFPQIKPMKRSGGRRYYRPDDVDLLRGIRRLLYGEGYTIRGVQRILKEQGVKTVQALATPSAAAPPLAGKEKRVRPSAPVDAEPDERSSDEQTPAAAPAAVTTRGAPAPSPLPRVNFPARPAAPATEAPGEASPRPAVRALDLGRLKTALDDLVACKQLVDNALQAD